MYRYKLVFSYDGTSYFGYERQVDKPSIEGEIEKNLSLILNESILIYASGRTDKGVHALNQVAHFDSSKEILDLDKFKNSINKLLNDDIFIKEICLVNEDFHARFSAKGKEYFYIINTGEYSPFLRNYELFLENIDVKKMELAAKLFIGTHDFKDFTSKPVDDDNFVRQIDSITFSFEDQKLKIYFVGNGFMRYEIRKIAGTLIEVGKGKIGEDFIKAHLASKIDRDIVPYQAPAQGLYLYRVIY